MANAPQLTVGLGFDLDEASAKKVVKGMEQLGTYLEKSANDAAKKVEKNWTSSLVNMAKGWVAFEASTRGFQAVKDLFLLEEKFRSMQLPLKNLTEGTGDFGLSLSFITSLADRTGQDLFVLGDGYKGIYASAKQAGIATDEVNKIFSAVVRSGASLRLSNDQVSLSLKAIEQMMNKGVISSEELRQQLGDHIPGAYALMAKAAQDAGISVSGSTQELAKLLEQGKVGSAQVLPFFAKRMEEAFGKNAEANLNTISGSANRLGNELTYLVSALDESKVTSFWAKIQNGIADVMKDLTFMTKSGTFNDFVSYLTGQGGVTTGKRLATELQDKNFAKKSPKDQAKEYRELNIQLKESVKLSRDLLSAGITPQTDNLTKLADQVRRYKEIMGGGSGSGSNPPSHIGGDGEDVKKIKNAGFNRLEAFKKMHTEEVKERDKQFFERLQQEKEFALELEKLLSLDGLPTVAPPTLDFNLNKSLNITGLKDELGGQMEGLSDFLLNNWNDLRSRFNELNLPEFPSMQPIFEKLKINWQDGISDAEAAMVEKFLTMKDVLQSVLSTALGGLANLMSTGLANMFNQDVEFDPKKMIAQILESVGEMLIGIAVPLVAALALGNVATMGGMSVQWGAALGLLGAGIAMKGGGMAISGGQSSSPSESSNYQSQYRGSMSGMQQNNKMQTVEVRFANGALKGYTDYQNKKYNG